MLVHSRRWVASTPNKASDRWGHSAARARLSMACQGQSLFERALHVRHIIAFYNEGRENIIIYNRFRYKIKFKNSSQGLKPHLEHCHNALAARFCFHYSSGFGGVIVDLDLCMLWADPGHRLFMIQLKDVDIMKNSQPYRQQTMDFFSFPLF